jgi:imidazolonepropionase
MPHILFRNFKTPDLNFQKIFVKQAMCVKDGKIQFLGPQEDVLKKINSEKIKITKEFDLKSSLIFPSFIECHTHTMFAGSRAEEFELRNNGVSYLEIARRGGGILSTMNATRKEKSSQLIQTAQQRVDRFVRQGVSTLEMKSGYALDLKNEVKMLKAINQIKGPRIIPTFLGAHAKPPEFSSHAEYLKFLTENVLPVLKKKKLANRVDIFIETNFFEEKESENYLRAAQAMGFALTIHANQLSLSAGAELALRLNACSADHLIHLNKDLISRFAKSKTVAVLLPMADLYMKCAYPPARQLIDSGATVALATDFNPGSCPSQDLALVGLLARLEMKMTLPEVFKAYTSGAAKALLISHEEGVLEVGKYANFIRTDADLNDFFYSAGYTPEHQLFIRGRRV